MSRATFLIVEVKPREGLSVRKLVIETALHNVITAYSAPEGIEIFHRFPAVDAVIVHAQLPDYGNVLSAIKRARPEMPTVLVSPRAGAHHNQADHVLSSHTPQELLDLLEQIVDRDRLQDSKKQA
jgi:hypothetical protein